MFSNLLLKSVTLMVGRSQRSFSTLGKFFLQLAKGSAPIVLRSVSYRQDAEEVLFSRKDMIKCAMFLNLNGRWEVCRLSYEMKKIVAQYPKN